MDPVLISGFEYEPRRKRARIALERAALAPSPETIDFVLGRASQFIESGARGRVPAWTYPRIARNLRKSRRVKLTGKQVLRLVRKLDPELYRRRAEANKPKQRTDPRTGAKVSPHWIFDAYDLIVRGATDAQALARFGYHRRPKPSARAASPDVRGTSADRADGTAPTLPR